MSTSNGGDLAPKLNTSSVIINGSRTNVSNEKPQDAEPEEDQPPVDDPRVVRARADPWAPIVLSLDGGGIKGLSELFLLLKIMDRVESLIIQELDEGSNIKDAALFAFLRDAILLPCYFFDFMVGTSTGGLIAVMLGRLRMSVPDAIKAYWRLGNDIFLSRRIVRSYSSKKLRRAIIQVVKENCGCHARGQNCHDLEPLRQYDYAERGDISYAEDTSRKNFTCKTALVAQRKKEGAQVPHLFRSYNHTRRSEKAPREHNPMTLGRNTLQIWKACRATSAAPFYFRPMTIGRDKFLDGGVGNNNPSNIAWSEVLWMLKPLHPQPNATPDDRTVAAMVSLGCGEKEKHHLFGKQKSLFFLWETFRYGRGKITDTENVHEATSELAAVSRSAYYRFSVKAIEGDDGNDGLNGIKLATCKRRTKNKLVGEIRRLLPFLRQEEPELPLEGIYTTLQEEATPQDGQRKRGDFQPDKYHYPTFDTIFTRTERYCGMNNNPGVDVRGDIERCAEILLIYAKARYADNLERWKCHVSHPDPGHPSYLESTWRTQD